jgi:hypothetical protein
MCTLSSPLYRLCCEQFVMSRSVFCVQTVGGLQWCRNERTLLVALELCDGQKEISVRDMKFCLYVQRFFGTEKCETNVFRVFCIWNMRNGILANCSFPSQCLAPYAKTGTASPRNFTNNAPNTWRNIPEDLTRRAAAACCVTFRRRSKCSGWASSFTPLCQSPLED